MFAGLCLGILLGMLLQRTQYCSMGALSDVFLFGSWRRLRVWGLAAAVGIFLTQWLIHTSRIDLSQTHYLADGFRPIGLVAGGILFGWGMVLAGGCASRNLVRAGQGSLKAASALTIMILTAAIVSSGPLNMLPAILGLGLEITALPASLPMTLGLLLAALVAAACLYPQFLAKQWQEIVTGLLLGCIVAAAWPLSMEFEGQIAIVPAAIDLVSSSNALLLWLTIDKVPNFGAALMAGTFMGALSLAVMAARFRLESFTAADDMLRHCVGGALMGVGGAVALGDTLGQGLSGFATLSISAVFAVCGMVVGARLGLLQLESGGFWLLVQRLSRSARSAKSEAGQ